VQFFFEIFILCLCWLYTQSVGLLGLGISYSQGRYRNTEQHKQNKREQKYMPRVGVETTVPAFDRVKTIHVLDRAVTVIRWKYFTMS
jgi:hypothetical protein